MKRIGLLTLKPILVPKPWGGNRLRASGKAAQVNRDTTTRYGESWEVADLPGHALSASSMGRTLVASGAHRGKSLRQVIAELGPALLGNASPTPAGDFPLLFKLLDTAEHLSIQVHPDEGHASGHKGWFAKTESWYVLDAAPGAAIFKGFRPGIGMDEIREAAGTPALADLLQRIPVQSGDFHHIPAGTVHALGAGVTVAEVQTPSDTTFRLYDWTEEYHRPTRPLHIREAVACLSIRAPDAAFRSAMVEDGDRLLVRTPYYWIREHRSTDRDIIFEDSSELRILKVAEGRTMIGWPGHERHDLATGSTTVVPASTAGPIHVMAQGTATLLEIGIV